MASNIMLGEDGADVKEDDEKIWCCNACADAENAGYYPCTFTNQIAPNEQPTHCPISSEECEWEKLES